MWELRTSGLPPSLPTPRTHFMRLCHPPYCAAPFCAVIQGHVLVFNDLTVVSRAGKVLKTEDDLLAGFHHAGRMTDLQVRAGAGAEAAGCQEGPGKHMRACGAGRGGASQAAHWTAVPPASTTPLPHVPPHPTPSACPTTPPHPSTHPTSTHTHTPQVVSQGGGQQVVLFTTAEGALFLVRLVVPLTPGAGRGEIQVLDMGGGDGEEGEGGGGEGSLAPWLRLHSGAAASVDMHPDTKVGQLRALGRAAWAPPPPLQRPSAACCASGRLAPQVTAPCAAQCLEPCPPSPPHTHPTPHPPCRALLCSAC